MQPSKPSAKKKAQVTALTADGRWATVEVVRKNGSKVTYSGPTKPLGVRFTPRGIEVVDTGSERLKPLVSEASTAERSGDPTQTQTPAPKQTQRLINRSKQFLRRAR